jgi:hypothetical protein
MKESEKRDPSSSYFRGRASVTTFSFPFLQIISLSYPNVLVNIFVARGNKSFLQEVFQAAMIGFNLETLFE